MPEDPSKNFKLAVEIAGTQVRFGLIPVDLRLEGKLYSKLQHEGYERDFKGNALSPDDVKFIYDNALVYLQGHNVTKEQIIAIGITVIANFNGKIPTTSVNVGGLEIKFSKEFPFCKGDYPIVSQNRTVIASRAEWEYGYGKDVKPNDKFIYFTISKNVNITYLEEGKFDPVKVPNQEFYHEVIKAEILQNYEGDSIAITPCEQCGEKLCFMNLVSGYGMAKQMAKIVTTGTGDPGFVGYMNNVLSDKEYGAQYDLGGVFELNQGQRGINLAKIYGRAVVEAAIGTGDDPNANAAKIVKRACAALGYVIAKNLTELHPDVVVLGGIFSLLKNDEYINICRTIKNQNVGFATIQIDHSNLEGVAALLGAAVYANPSEELYKILWKN